MEKERYILQPSQEKEDYLVCTDTLAKLVCVFKKHNFNNDQKFTFLDFDKDLLAKYSPEQIAQIANQMGEWLRANHYNDCF